MAGGSKKRATSTKLGGAAKRARNDNTSGGSGNKSNPFEKRELKGKHKVFGQQPKGRKVDMAKSKQQAIEKRKESLLVEFQGRNKLNTFQDKRFGQDSGMSAEEVKMERMKKERQRRLLGSSKAERFHLDDKDELTHLGSSLSTIKHHDAPGGADSDDEGGAMDAMDTGANFGGGNMEGEDRGRRTKREVMHEVIQKSKYFKMERQAQNSEQVNLVHSLDADFGDIRGMMEFKQAEDDKMEETAGADGVEMDEMDEFNLETKELAMDMKATAVERLKTPEEVAKEARARLEALEERRKKRMMGEMSKEEIVKAEQGGGYAGRRAKQKAEEEKAERKRAGGDADDDDGLADPDGEDGLLDDGVGGNYEIDQEFVAVESGGEEEDEEAVENAAVRIAAESVAAKRELPFVFAAPATYKEFTELLKGRSQVRFTVLLNDELPHKSPLKIWVFFYSSEIPHFTSPGRARDHHRAHPYLPPPVSGCV